MEVEEVDAHAVHVHQVVEHEVRVVVAVLDLGPCGQGAGEGGALMSEGGAMRVLCTCVGRTDARPPRVARPERSLPARSRRSRRACANACTLMPKRSPHLAAHHTSSSGRLAAAGPPAAKERPWSLLQGEGEGVE